MLQTYNPKNKDLLVYVNGNLLHRDEAHVSVFDSSVQGGDAVWEGLRVYKNGIFCFKKHIDRLINSAKALAFENIPTEDEIRSAVKETLEANNMTDETHIRLTLTRGIKITSGMDPRLNQSGCTLIVLAEWKPLVYDNEKGIKVISSHIRRNLPQFLDSKIHHANLLNNILAKIQANIAGMDAAVMLDERGFVAELNDVNLFIVKDGKVYTPYANACLNGITRGL
ncbi:MAG: aminotransferase class IV, partial [bacterium]|nr:aminotransferase class IV [bacterium]